MRYLTLAEALVVAEAVTGIDAAVLAKMPGIGLLDSALHASQAEFGGQEFYPDFIDKAAVNAVRIFATTRFRTDTSVIRGLVSHSSAS